MRETLYHLLAGIVLFAVACQPNDTSLTDTEKSQIEADVRVIFDALIDAVNEHDVDEIMGYILESDELRHAGGGSLFFGWNTLHEAVSNWHADPANQAWSVTMDEVIVEVLSREIAILTARGTATN
ncbi:MAG TPA: nuclear transport factor 2 family protein, partial [Pseudomonadales bacterium]